MSTEKAFRINTPNVVGEEFEGEVVVVNLESGCYFSLTGGAKDIWQILARGAASTESIIATLVDTLDCSGADVQSDVVSFLEELGRLELVISDDSPGSTIAREFEASETPVRQRFETPRIETFTDLQDILLLDPIHDVDEAGWPMAGPDHITPN